jgi:hypothetical protein
VFSIGTRPVANQSPPPPGGFQVECGRLPGLRPVSEYRCKPASCRGSVGEWPRLGVMVYRRARWRQCRRSAPVVGRSSRWRLASLSLFVEAQALRISIPRPHPPCLPQGNLALSVRFVPGLRRSLHGLLHRRVPARDSCSSWAWVDIKLGLLFLVSSSTCVCPAAAAPWANSNMANFRALQPAPLDEEAPPQHLQSRPLLTQKPKRTVTLGACVACRKRKSKCDGNRPVCTCCSQKDTDCVYELGPNEKPSQAMKRKNEEMQGELSNLRQLYDFLRLRPEHEAMEILRRIRANPINTPPSQRIQELAEFVRHGDPLNQTPSYPPPSPYQHDPGRAVTLPPIRLALDSSADLDAPFPGMLPMGMDGPMSQRRRHVSDVDGSTR